eukprot:TRINITY_DN65886_c0_g1_i1.p2 TRINITY_DN65886_c0_g1~~TRINITY_DN65886_c0_g1_i1.p2  ORF type:complete len:314 (+),score=44.98 TRINITY_DN65886_c0_g1_i1:71-1012(+)
MRWQRQTPLERAAERAEHWRASVRVKALLQQSENNARSLQKYRSLVHAHSSLQEGRQCRQLQLVQHRAEKCAPHTARTPGDARHDTRLAMAEQHLRMCDAEALRSRIRERTRRLERAAAAVRRARGEADRCAAHGRLRPYSARMLDRPAESGVPQGRGRGSPQPPPPGASAGPAWVRTPTAAQPLTGVVIGPICEQYDYYKREIERYQIRHLPSPPPRTAPEPGPAPQGGGALRRKRGLCAEQLAALPSGTLLRLAGAGAQQPSAPPSPPPSSCGRGGSPAGFLRTPPRLSPLPPPLSPGAVYDSSAPAAVRR